MASGRVHAVVRTLIDDDGRRLILREEKRPQQGYGQGRFHIVFEGPLKQRTSRIKTLPAFRMFFLLPDYLTFTEFRTLRQEDLAAQMNVSQGTVSRALSELTELGIIERTGSGPVTRWRLSLDWGWRGKVKAYHKAKGERHEKAPRLKVVASNPPTAPAA